jgi:soluble lytic murein transglycosylase-like protein
MKKKKTTMKIKQSGMALLPLCLVVSGCSFPWSTANQPVAASVAPVAWELTDAAAAAATAVNSFPHMPDGVKSENHFPVMPLNWTVAGEKMTVAAAGHAQTAHKHLEDTPAAKVEAKLVSELASSEAGSRYHGLISKVSEEVEVDPNLLHAIIKVESNYQAHAVSPKGARGLMQVMPATGKRFGYTNLSNPEHNVRAGATYLKWLMEHFNDDLHLVLAGYNAGEGAVKKYGRQIPPYRETQQYVAKVMSYYQPVTARRSDTAAKPKPAPEKPATDKSKEKPAEGKPAISKLLGLLLSTPQHTPETLFKNSEEPQALL